MSCGSVITMATNSSAMTISAARVACALKNSGDQIAFNTSCTANQPSAVVRAGEGGTRSHSNHSVTAIMT